MEKDIQYLQDEAFSHILSSFNKLINPICALSMGLGKTRVACNIINYIINNIVNYRVLIVIKASHYENPWIDELFESGCIIAKEDNNGNKKNLQFENCIYLHGEERHKYSSEKSSLFHLPSKNIFISSYDTIRIDIEEGRYDNSLFFDLVVFDELQLIMNTKKQTKKLLALNKLNSSKRIALSGTPIQNTSKELGLMYIFLNNEILLSDYFSLKKNRSMMKQIEIEKEKERILENGINDCKNNNALFLGHDIKIKHNKLSKILSLPINPIHYDLTHKYFGNDPQKYLQKKLMFLSSPGSVYYSNAKIEELPYCTKETAVKIIIQHMGNDEKAIIFSSFKDVVDSYYDLIQGIDYPALIITGEDKGKFLKDKISQFRNSSYFKVLLTTLQMSSEGFNFDFANHIIILEFWWNPQKIIQAMSRIDRIKQNKDIYMYLLCYHESIEDKNDKDEIIRNNYIIKEESIFYSTMKKKVTDANIILSEIFNKYNKNNTLSIKELPEVIEFENYNTFKEDLSLFLEKYHSPYLEYGPENIIGVPLSETVNNIVYEISNFHQLSDILLRFPWRICNPEIKKFLIAHYAKRLSGSNGDDLQEKIKQAYYLRKPFHKKTTNYDSFYPFLFFCEIPYFAVNINGIKEYISVPFVLGKRQNGLYHILLPQDLVSNSAQELRKFILNYKYDIIIIESIIDKNIFSILDNEPNFILSLTSIINKLGVYESLGKNRQYIDELQKIEFVFTQATIKDAAKLTENLKKTTDDYRKAIIYRKFKLFLQYISPLYRYPLNSRSTISTNNIIDILGIIINELLKNMNYCNFKNLYDAKRYISIAANEIINNGHELIPNWENLIKPIK